MNQQPKIPTLKDSQKPAVKLRGLGAGLSLVERMKQFKKKDLAFIMAGLGTLFMAPVAEHFMMSPESADGQLSPGMSRGGAPFGDGRSPYERADGMAPGGPTGGGSDVITPLNARDPSNLVMGFGAAQQPPTNSALSPTSPSARSDSDLKDALAASARGVGAAAKKAALPVPKVSLGGSALRGLGVAGGGSSASAGLGPVSSNGLAPNKADSGGRLGRVTAAPGYKGVAARGPGMGGGGAIDALRKAADSAAGAMNRGGSASGDLSDAASQAIPGGGGFAGNGQGGAAPNDKAFSGSQDKSAKSVGESLDFLKRKMQQEKDLELAYKKKEANDWGLQTALWRNKMIESVTGKISEGIGGLVTDKLKDLVASASGDSTPGFFCNDGKFYKASNGYVLKDGDLYTTKDSATPIARGCQAGSKSGGGGETPKPPDEPKGGATQTGGAYSPAAVRGASLVDLCNKLDGEFGDGKTIAPDVGTFLISLYGEARTLVVVADMIGAQGMDTHCAGPFGSGVKPVKPEDKGNIAEMLKADVSATFDAIKEIKDAIKKEEAVDPLPGSAELQIAVDQNEKIEKMAAEAKLFLADPKASAGEAAAIPESWKGPDMQAKAVAYQGELKRWHDAIQGVVEVSNKFQDNMNKEHVQLSFIVGGGTSKEATLKDIIEQNSAVKTQSDRADGHHVPHPSKTEGPASGDIGLDSTKAAIETTKKKLIDTETVPVGVPPQPVPKGLQRGLDYYEDTKNKELLKDDTFRDMVLTEISESWGEAKASMDSMRKAQNAWVNDIAKDIAKFSEECQREMPKLAQ